LPGNFIKFKMVFELLYAFFYKPFSMKKLFWFIFLVPFFGCDDGVGELQSVSDPASIGYARLGFSVSISGNFAFVGSPTEHITGHSSDPQGTVSIYRFDGTNWVLMQKIYDPDGDPDVSFGASLSISGNYAIVGSPGASSLARAAIYRYDGTNWVLMQVIRLTRRSYSGFAGSLSISGNYAVIGHGFDDIHGTGERRGSAGIYHFNGSGWVLMQTITDETGAAEDHFGLSVAISNNTVIVGAPGDDVGTQTDQGSASIYRYNGTNWVLSRKITDGAGAAGDHFGNRVSLSGDYSAIVGIPGDDVGTNIDQGSASIYRNNGTSWLLTRKINDDDGAAGDEFGASVSISSRYVIMGAPGDDIGANTDQGSASLYVRQGSSSVIKIQYLTDPDCDSDDRFGYSNAIVEREGRRFLIGAPEHSDGRGKGLFGKIIYPHFD
jgi:hypothetical protein